MTTIAQVRDELTEAIIAGCGLRASAYLSDNVNAPTAHVWPLAFDPRLVLHQAKAAHNFRVRVFVGRVAERSAQVKLDELREVTGSTSLTAAVQDSDNWPTQPPIVDYAVVTQIGEPQTDVVADEVFMICDFDIEVVF